MERWLSPLLAVFVAAAVLSTVIESNLTSLYVAFVGGGAALTCGRVGLNLVRTERLFFIAFAALIVWAAMSYSFGAAFLPRDPAKLLKLFGLVACLTMVLAAPVSGRAGWAAIVGLILGFAGIAAFLVEVGTTGVLRDMLPVGGADNPFIHNNIENQPAQILAVFIIPLFLAIYAAVRAGRIPKWALLGALVYPGAILIVGHKTGVLALAVGGAAFVLARWAPRATVALGVLVLAIFAFLIPAALPSWPLDGLLSATRNDASIQHRLLIADYASTRIQERPVLGWGLEASKYIPDGGDPIVDTASRMDRVDPALLDAGVRDVAQNLPLHPHNAAMQVRLELGAVGAALWLLIVWCSARRILSIADPTIRAAGLAQGAAIMAIWSVGFSAWQTWWIATIILGVLAFRLAIGAGLRR